MDEAPETEPPRSPSRSVSDRPRWLDPPPDPSPRPPHRPPWLDSPAAPAAPGRRPGWSRAALAGGVAGAVLAAAVSFGVNTAMVDERTAAVAPVIVRPSAEIGRDLDVRSLLAVVSPAVVAITAVGVGAGSGMVIDDDGLVLTNSHVVRGARAITVTTAAGEEREADLVGDLPDADLAVVRLRDPRGLVAVTLGSSSKLQVGDDVVAVGNALGLGSEPTVTSGIVSALGRAIDVPNGPTLRDLVQTDAAINPGNSGGPLVNSAGEVVGVNTVIAAGGAQNIGFAISIDSVRPLLARLRSGVGGALLGVTTLAVANVTAAVRARFGIVLDRGAFVQSVLPGSGADRAGLREGDVIVGLGDTEVATNADVSDFIGERVPGDEVEVVYIREGDRRTTTATLGSRRGA